MFNPIDFAIMVKTNQIFDEKHQNNYTTCVGKNFISDCFIMKLRNKIEFEHLQTLREIFDLGEIDYLYNSVKIKNLKFNPQEVKYIKKIMFCK